MTVNAERYDPGTTEDSNTSAIRMLHREDHR